MHTRRAVWLASELYLPQLEMQLQRALTAGATTDWLKRSSTHCWPWCGGASSGAVLPNFASPLLAGWAAAAGRPSRPYSCSWYRYCRLESKSGAACCRVNEAAAVHTVLIVRGPNSLKKSRSGNSSSGHWQTSLQWVEHLLRGMAGALRARFTLRRLHALCCRQPKELQVRHRRRVPNCDMHPGFRPHLACTHVHQPC